MPKAKVKEPFAQLASSFKKNVLGPWGPRSKQIVSAMERVRGGMLDELYECDLLADSILTQQEAKHFPEIQLRLSSSPRSARMTLYPDVWAAWLRHPKTVELSDDAATQLELYEGDLGSATFDKLPDLFPGCLLIDTSALGKKCLYPEDSLEAVFVFPSVDSEHGVIELSYVALLGENIASAARSYLHLDANTIGKARSQTDARAKAYWDSMKDGPIDLASSLGNAVIAEQYYLNQVVDRILALFLSGVYVAEESVDEGISHIVLRTAAEVGRDC